MSMKWLDTVRKIFPSGGGGAGVLPKFGAGGRTLENSVLTDKSTEVECTKPLRVVSAITEGPMTVGQSANIVGFNDWMYRQSIDVNASAAETGYQVRLELDTATLISAGKMQSAGQDIRVTSSDGTTLLKHHIERGINTATTVIYFKETIASGSNTVFIYYGNPSAADTQDPDNVYEFWDDFPGTSIDTGKWTITDGTGFTVANDELTGTNTTGRLRSVPTFSEPTIAETEYVSNTDATNGQMALSFWNSTTDGFGFLDHDGANDFVRTDGTWSSVGDVTPSGIGLLIRITPNGASSNINIVRLDTGAVILDDTRNNTVDANTGLMLGQRADDTFPGQAYDADWPWVRVRKYTATEPTVTPGAETTINADYQVIDASGIQSLPAQPRCRATRTTSVSIPTATATDVTFPAEDYDVGGMHDTSTNTDRITIPIGGDGIYVICAGARFASNGVGQRTIKISINGVFENDADAVKVDAAGISTTMITTSRQANLVAGDIVRISVTQTSGISLNLNDARVEVCKLA